VIPPGAKISLFDDVELKRKMIDIPAVSTILAGISFRPTNEFYRAVLMLYAFTITHQRVIGPERIRCTLKNIPYIAFPTLHAGV
jgi:hypothetical protein